LTLHKDFLFEGTIGTEDERSVFPNGALQLKNGTIAVTYMGQGNDDSWGGIFLATSDCALGCPWTKHGVVLSCALHSADPSICMKDKPPIHEHDLLQLTNGTFVVFYAGNTPHGDQGYMATSEDLIHWTSYAGNPALPLPIAECGVYPNCRCWDGSHRRPRSLFTYQGHWYLLYEGTNPQAWTRTHSWGDTIGLMHSETLEGPYTERHPLQLSVPPLADPSFDSTWTGWPRAHIDEARGELLILYAAGGRGMKNASMHPFASTGLRRWNLSRLKEWQTLDKAPAYSSEHQSVLV